MSLFVVLPEVVQCPPVQADQYCSVITEWAVLLCKLSPVDDEIRTDIEKTHLETSRAVGIVATHLQLAHSSQRS